MSNKQPGSSRGSDVLTSPEEQCNFLGLLEVGQPENGRKKESNHEIIEPISYVSILKSWLPSTTSLLAKWASSINTILTESCDRIRGDVQIKNVAPQTQKANIKQRQPRSLHPDDTSTSHRSRDGSKKRRSPSQTSNKTTNRDKLRFISREENFTATKSSRSQQTVPNFGKKKKSHNRGQGTDITLQDLDLLIQQYENSVECKRFGMELPSRRQELLTKICTDDVYSPFELRKRPSIKWGGEKTEYFTGHCSIENNFSDEENINTPRKLHSSVSLHDSHVNVGFMDDDSEEWHHFSQNLASKLKSMQGEQASLAESLIGEVVQFGKMGKLSARAADSISKSVPPSPGN